VEFLIKGKKPSVDEYRAIQNKEIEKFMDSRFAALGTWVSGTECQEVWPHKTVTACQRLLDKMEKQGILSVKKEAGKNWYCKRNENPLTQSWRSSSNEDLLGHIYDELRNL